MNVFVSVWNCAECECDYVDLILALHPGCIRNCSTYKLAISNMHCMDICVILVLLLLPLFCVILNFVCIAFCNAFSTKHHTLYNAVSSTSVAANNRNEAAASSTSISNSNSKYHTTDEQREKKNIKCTLRYDCYAETTEPLPSACV